MLNCIIATMRPNARMKRPSTPVSFMRRSTTSVALLEVRISRNRRLASGSVAQLGVDELERARRQPQRVGMERQIVLLGEMEDADQVDRIAIEHVLSSAMVMRL